jgi:hypothetical protein
MSKGLMSNTPRLCKPYRATALPKGMAQREIESVARSERREQSPTLQTSLDALEGGNQQSQQGRRVDCQVTLSFCCS